MQYKKSQKYSNGVTLVEILVVLAIIFILTLIGFGSFRDLNSRQAVDKTALLVLSVLDEARSLTLSAKDSSQYGVHFETAQVVLFTGAVYSSGNPTNQASGLGGKVSISSVNLFSGGATDVVFDRLTGTTVNTGTVVISLNEDTSVRKTITIYQTGVAQSN